MFFVAFLSYIIIRMKSLTVFIIITSNKYLTKKTFFLFLGYVFSRFPIRCKYCHSKWEVVRYVPTSFQFNLYIDLKLIFTKTKIIYIFIVSTETLNLRNGRPFSLIWFGLVWEHFLSMTHFSDSKLSELRFRLNR